MFSGFAASNCDAVSPDEATEEASVAESFNSSNSQFHLKPVAELADVEDGGL